MPRQAIWNAYGLLGIVGDGMIRKKLMAFRILIVDDSVVFRQGLRNMLESRVDWEICGEAADGIEGVEKNRSLVPNLILMDLSMPRMTGLESAAEILKEYPKVPIVLLTLYVTKQLEQEARKIGIRATVSKTRMHELADGINQALQGEQPAPPL